MRILAQVTPTLKITARLSSNYNVRHYSSIVHLLHRRRIYNRDVRCNELSIRRFNEGRKSSGTSSKHVLRDQELELRGLNSAFLPIALIDLNPLSTKSAKVLLIPLNWHDADEHALRNTITSIFAKPRNIRQIEAFSQALKDVPTYGDAGNKQVKRKATEDKKILPVSKVKNVFNYPKPRKENVHFVDNIELNVNHLDRLALALDKCLKQYCLHSMQMWTDNQMFGDNNTFYALSPNTSFTESAENSAGLSSLLNIDYSKINLGDFTWHRNIPFLELQSNTLKTINLPTTVAKKSFSTKTTQKLLGAPAENTQPAARRSASSVKTGKCMANYDFPFLANLFGTKDLLMSCDTYNKALIEASKRREALAKIAKQLKTAQASTFNRPKVMNIKGCTLSQSIVKASAPCPAIPKPASSKPSILADDGCKKDDPCKPPKCPDPCKDEMEKLKQLKEEEMRRKKKKMPTGCVSPKCKKEDRCGKLNTKKKCDAVKPEMKLSCKKDDPCKPAECPDPCKDEMEKLERLKNEDLKRKKGKIPTGCISPKCKKQDTCKNPKKSPCKKLQGSNTKLTTVQCAKKSPSDSCTKGKEKGKKKGHPCDDDKEEKEYKPKCNKDPCKGDQTCGGSSKKKAAPCAKTESACKMKAGGSDPCKKDSVTKQAACKKKNDPKKKKNDGCKKKKDDPCGKKKKDDPCGKKKKDDPCGKKKKDDPCGKKKKDDPCGKKKKDDPCGKKKKDDPCGKKKKDDPCGKKKKDDPCGKKKKDDPCGKKKKDDPCGKKKKDDPCGKKKKDDPCGKKKKNDPCGKKDGKSKGYKKKKCPEDRLPCDNKDDPCKKKASSPCNNKKDAKSKSSKPSTSKSSCTKQRKSTKPNCKKSYSTLSQTRRRSFASPLRRFYSNFMSLPLLKNKNMFSYGFTRYFSSKKDGKKGGKKGKKDFGKISQCHAAATHVPPKRKNIPNPHPKDGLRKCYPTYDMDCRKLCKDARKTSCKKFAFLKDTDDKKRSENRFLQIQTFKNRYLCTNYKSPQLYFRCCQFHSSSHNGSNFSFKDFIPFHRETNKQEDIKCKMPVDLNKLDNEEPVNKGFLDKLLEKKVIFNEAIGIEKAGTTQKLITEIPTISNYDILIRTTKIAISDSDIHCFENGVKSGITLGHDAVGVVVDVGSNVTNFKPGDRVVVESGLSCGICDFCKKGAYNMCSKLMYNGFFVRYQAHPADLCYKLPSTLSSAEGALTQTLALGCQAVFSAPITPASNVLIMGCGATAVACALCADAIGAKKVALTCTVHASLESIRRTFGFDYVHYNHNSDPAEQLESIFYVLKDWPDVVINCGISDHTMSVALTALKPCGCCILTECDTENVTFNAFDTVMKNIRLIPSIRSNNMFPIAINLMSSGRAPIGKILYSIYSWNSIDEAFRIAQNASNSGYQKVVVHCGSEETLRNKF